MKMVDKLVDAALEIGRIKREAIRMARKQQAFPGWEYDTRYCDEEVHVSDVRTLATEAGIPLEMDPDIEGYDGEAWTQLWFCCRGVKFFQLSRMEDCKRWQEKR